MVETDWKEILSFSQRELGKSDKEKLCESLSWMEADDIELNFTDLKTLFRLAQDILKYKSEQVNNLMGQLETSQRKIKSKSKGISVESPTRSSDSVLETIAHQEEVIKANKEILEQLYADIADLQGRKNKLEESSQNLDRESESSRDALSEINAIAELEAELNMKNRHIRKLLGDVKVLEEENTKLKEKVSVLKEKLTEATELIENLTEQLFSINNENSRMKDVLGKSEKTKTQLSVELEALRKELLEKESSRENIYEEVRVKVQHWKNIARSKKAEIEALFIENEKLKDDLKHVSTSSFSPKKTKVSTAEELKIKELQEKLCDASNEILESAKLIETLKAEKKQLKASLEETPDFSVTDSKNESDDGKQRTLICKLKKRVKFLTVSLQGAEEMIALREKELTEITAQIQLIKSNEGVKLLLEGLKNKKRKLKLKDEGIKSLVQDVNNLNQIVNDLQMENETLRTKMNIPPEEKISTVGIIKKYRKIEQNNVQLAKDLSGIENEFVTSQMENYELQKKVFNLITLLKSVGCDQDKIDEVCNKNEQFTDEMPMDGGGEATAFLAKQSKSKSVKDNEVHNEECNAIIEENEGLRKALQEMLDFLKDNSTTSSGILSLQCPSLDAILQSMEARHAAGWFAPHMSTVMELRAALGGKDALLTALHEARMETFDVMQKLQKESQKSQELEQKLHEIETKEETQQHVEPDILSENMSIGEFGSWVSEKEQNNIDLFNKNEVESFINKGNFLYEKKLQHGLVYFHEKFKTLFEKMATIAVQAADDRNKWSLREEKYKAEVENLKAQISSNDEDDASEISPGLINVPNAIFLQRKCSYLEESYKYIRTLNENIKNEHLEAKRDALILSNKYESQIQQLILSVANLTDKLRSSVSVDLFWKQNKTLNEINLKYRQMLEESYNKNNESSNLFRRLESDKKEIISNFHHHFHENKRIKEDSNTKIEKMLTNVEQTVLTQQLEKICNELENKNKEIEKLKSHNAELQSGQSKAIDQMLAAVSKDDIDFMKEQLQTLTDKNHILKEQCQHVESQLDIALLQLQDSQQRQMSNDMEINLLRHQILDLQSTGDNKAVIARLSGEVLVAHLQATESHKKIERLNASQMKEKQMRIEAEEMLGARQKVFDVYCSRHESKFRYMYEVMQVLRNQYEGSLPTIALESFLNNKEDLNRKTYDVDKKLDEIEELRSNLMTKHSVFNQILDISKNKCVVYDENNNCQHKLQNIVLQGTHTRELDFYKNKIKTLDQSREDLIKRCSYLEKTLILVNQAVSLKNKEKNTVNDSQSLLVEDVKSDDGSSSESHKTLTLTQPQVLKAAKSKIDMTKTRKEQLTENLSSFMQTPRYQKPEVVNEFVQTTNIEKKEKSSKLVQTDDDTQLVEQNKILNNFKKELENKNRELFEAVKLAQKHTEEIIALKKEKLSSEAVIHAIKDSNQQKDKLNERLFVTVEELRKQIDECKHMQATEKFKVKEEAHDENKSLLNAFKKFENDKNTIVAEYKDLLSKERNHYSTAMKELQAKILDLETQILNRSGNEESSESLKEAVQKYTMKITELEDKCFKYQSELDERKTEVLKYESESDRWKDLATERLAKLEQLSSQLEERHCHEVESYKAENEHWLCQMSEMQREHLTLRSKLTEQKAAFVKQLADKDTHIEQMRNISQGLKSQIMFMQTMISVSDPSFDLSAIVEVDESSEANSQHGSERLEIKFDSSGDCADVPDDTRIGSSSSGIWQESVIDRLRREKQMTAKQNALLRRQMKALAARERRARLDAQNLRNQAYRINTSGHKVVTAETAALHNKIASLQAQLTTARKDSHSTVALWDKWKRSQQASERWQVRFTEKCQEVKKLEASLNMAKSALSRLEKEKRVLLTRLAEVKDKELELSEKQDNEQLEKLPSPVFSSTPLREPVVSERALLDRVQAQQRRIVALEVAEKGNEHLVSEYERALAEITSLKGQVLKLESTLLESQIKVAETNNTKQDQQPELEYWKSYCEMLKEENVQLHMRVSSLEIIPHTSNQHRINDLEQTVLTLRGLVSKLQSEQKAGVVHKKPDSRPSSGRSSSFADKSRTQMESYRIEIANLKRSIQDKDLLLERSKEMLSIAAEREDELLREASIDDWDENIAYL